MNDLIVRLVETRHGIYKIYLIKGRHELLLNNYSMEDLRFLGTKGVVNSAKRIADILGCEIEYYREEVVLQKVRRLPNEIKPSNGDMF